MGLGLGLVPEPRGCEIGVMGSGWAERGQALDREKIPPVVRRGHGSWVWTGPPTDRHNHPMTDMMALFLSLWYGKKVPFALPSLELVQCGTTVLSTTRTPDAMFLTYFLV